MCKLFNILMKSVLFSNWRFLIYDDLLWKVTGKTMKRKKKLSFSKGLTTIEGSWKFDNNVALNFDEHVSQSIPHYKDIQKYVCSLSEWFLKENSTIYDLGCSTGETIKMLSNLSVSASVLGNPFLVLSSTGNFNFM